MATEYWKAFLKNIREVEEKNEKEDVEGKKEIARTLIPQMTTISSAIQQGQVAPEWCNQCLRDLDELQKNIKIKDFGLVDLFLQISIFLILAGGEESIIVSSAIEVLKNPFEKANQFIQLCNLKEGKKAYNAKVAKQIAQKMQEEAQWYTLCTRLHAVLYDWVVLYPRLREAIRNNEELCEWIESVGLLDERFDWVIKALNVCDKEKLIVILVDKKEAFELQVKNVYDNFQLHALLADVLHEHTEQKRIPRKVIDVFKGANNAPQSMQKYITGPWTLYQWSAIQPDHSIMREGVECNPNASHEEWKIYVKVDLANSVYSLDAFEGTRTIFLCTPTLPHNFNVIRMFEKLSSSVEIIKQFSTEETTQLIDRIVSKAPERRAELQAEHGN